MPAVARTAEMPTNAIGKRSIWPSARPPAWRRRLSVTGGNETVTSNGTTYTLSADLRRIDGRDTSATMRFDYCCGSVRNITKVIRRMNDDSGTDFPVTCSAAVPEAGFVISDLYTISGAPYDGSTAGIIQRRLTIVARFRSDSATPAFA